MASLSGYDKRACLHVLAVVSVPGFLYLILASLHFQEFSTGSNSLSLLGLDLVAGREILLFYSGLLLIIFSVTELLKSYLQSGLVRKAARVGYPLLLVVALLAACIHADNVVSWGPLVADTVEAILQTDSQEAWHYVAANTAFSAFLVFIVWVAAGLTSYVALLRLPKHVLSRRIRQALVLSALIGIQGIRIGSEDFHLIFRESLDYAHRLEEFQSSRASVLEQANLTTISAEFDGNIIVVLGESTSRAHLGIYGYFRNTTPRLAEIEDELAVFSDVISTHSHTKPSITDAFSFNDRSGRKGYVDVLDIVSFAKASSFQVEWLSNQNAYQCVIKPIS